MNAPCFTLTLFLSACLLLRAEEPAPAPPPVLDALPQEIGQFYIDANFAGKGQGWVRRRFMTGNEFSLQLFDKLHPPFTTAAAQAQPLSLSSTPAAEPSGRNEEAA